MRLSAAGAEGRGKYSAPFFAAYFFYYGGYCIFSSYMVMYFTGLGYSATLCGLIASLTLTINLITEPIGGYITDTYCSARQFLTVCVGIVAALCVLCTWAVDKPWICFPALVVAAGIAYPFSQLLDAWVNCSRELDPDLIYSRIRAGGSIGFALTSLVAGWYFNRFGWDAYFLIQAVLFLLMVPFLFRLPDVSLDNSAKEKNSLTFSRCIKTALKNRSYCLCLLICTVYWFSHRPIGSYLSLIVQMRGGGAGTYGAVCGVGAVVEFAGLLILGALQKRRTLSLPLCMAGALGFAMLRPLCILMLPGIFSLYLGQLFQSVSFALFYGGSAEWFTRTAHPQIRSFYISVGLTVSSVGGTICANLVGGPLCDGWSPLALVWSSLAIGAGNILLFLLGSRFPTKKL